MKHGNKNNNGGVEKQTHQSEMALAIAREEIAIGSKQSTLHKMNGNILSKRGLSVPALIEYLQIPKWLEVAEKYDPSSPHRSQRKLCSIETITKVLRRVAYDADIKKVRSWLPYARRQALQKGAFIVMQHAGHGKEILGDGQVAKHHGETIAVALCPEHPSPALRELALKQVQKCLDAGEMNNKQANRMRELLGEDGE